MEFNEVESQVLSLSVLLSPTPFSFSLFLNKVLKVYFGGRGRERPAHKELPSAGALPKCPSSWGWARRKLGLRSPVCVSDPNELSPAASQCMMMEAGVRSRAWAWAWAGHPDVECRWPSGILTTGLNACPSSSLLKPLFFHFCLLSYLLHGSSSCSFSLLGVCSVYVIRP